MTASPAKFLSPARDSVIPSLALRVSEHLQIYQLHSRKKPPGPPTRTCRPSGENAAQPKRCASSARIEPISLRSVRLQRRQVRSADVWCWLLLEENSRRFGSDCTCTTALAWPSKQCSSLP